MVPDLKKSYVQVHLPIPFFCTVLGSQIALRELQLVKGCNGKILKELEDPIKVLI
jgi:hypothetical protein